MSGYQYENQLDASEPERESTIKAFDYELSRLGELIDDTNRRLQPVLRPEGPEKAMELVQGPVSPLSTLVARLGELNARLQNINYRIDL